MKRGEERKGRGGMVSTMQSLSIHLPFREKKNLDYS